MLQHAQHGGRIGTRPVVEGERHLRLAGGPFFDEGGVGEHRRDGRLFVVFGLGGGRGMRLQRRAGPRRALRPGGRPMAPGQGHRDDHDQRQRDHRRHRTAAADLDSVRSPLLGAGRLARCGRLGGSRGRGWTPGPARRPRSPSASGSPLRADAKGRPPGASHHADGSVCGDRHLCTGGERQLAVHACQQHRQAGIFRTDPQQRVVTVVAALLDAALELPGAAAPADPARRHGGQSADPPPAASARGWTSSCSGRTITSVAPAGGGAAWPPRSGSAPSAVRAVAPSISASITFTAPRNARQLVVHGRLVELARSGVLHDPPVPQHRDRVRQRERLLLVVGDEHGRGALLAQQLRGPPHGRLPRRLASSEENGSSSSSTCGLRASALRECDALLLAAGELVGEALGEPGDADHLQQLGTRPLRGARDGAARSRRWPRR